MGLKIEAGLDFLLRSDTVAMTHPDLEPSQQPEHTAGNGALGELKGRDVRRGLSN